MAECMSFKDPVYTTSVDFQGSSEFLLVKRVKCGMFTEAVEKKSMVV